MDYTRTQTVSAIVNYQKPKDVTAIQRFVGIASCYRKFIKNFSERIVPLNNITKSKKKKQIVEWNPEAEQAFEVIKTRLVTTPVLSGHF